MSDSLACVYWGRESWCTTTRSCRLGRGHVVGKFTQPMTEASMLLLVLDKLGYVDIPLHIIILGTIVLIIFVLHLLAEIVNILKKMSAKIIFVVQMKIVMTIIQILKTHV